MDLWVQQRSEDGPLNGLWEFPGGKIELEEGPLAAAKREVQEEVGATFPKELEFELFKRHRYTHRGKDILLFVYHHNLEDPGPEFELMGKWVTLKFKDKSDHLKGLIPPVNHVIIDEFLETFVKRREIVFGPSLGL